MDKFKQLQSLVQGIEADAIKFYNNGNGAAGTRVRKVLQEIKGLAHEIRKDVTEIKNSK